MSAPAWTGIGCCVGCHREGVEVHASREHGERVLCDRCAARPSTISVDNRDVLALKELASANGSGLTAGAGRAGGATYKQEQDARRGRLACQRKPVPVPAPAPAPAVNSEQEPNELDLMLGQYQAGKIEPVSVTLGELPVRAGGAQRAVVEHMRLLMGLRRAYGDDRPLPYATSVPVAAGLVPNQGAASQILRSLVRYGVIDHVGALPPLKPGLDGTKLYAPPGGVRS